jgi:hypothetical protein
LAKIAGLQDADAFMSILSLNRPDESRPSVHAYSASGCWALERQSAPR